MINGKQCTICWHVDNLKISHVDPKIVTKIIEMLNSVYGQEVVGGKRAKLTIKRGVKHEYLGMLLDYSEKGHVKIDMTDYFRRMLEELPEEIKEDLQGTVRTPSANNLFKVQQSPLLKDQQVAVFHSTVAKLLFLYKQGRLDIQTAVAFLCTRVQKPTDNDLIKLARTVKYLRTTKELTLKLKALNIQSMKWWIDAVFRVHNDYKSHTGGMMSLGTGACYAISRKQKLNTQSSTKAELVGMDNVLP